MAVLYVVAAWLIMQVAEVLIALADLPGWTGPAILAVLAIGFPISLIFSWFFEITPEGLTLEKGVSASESITRVTGRRMDFIVISLLGAAVILFAYDKWWSPPPELSIAVLPFEDLGANSRHEYFVDGIHDELLTRLSQINALRVISRTSVMPYRNTAKSLPDVASELSVANVVEGSVQRLDNQVRINVQLIDARTDEHLWAHVFDRELTATNLFEVQSDIAKSIAQALHTKLTPEESQAVDIIQTDNLAAYDAYLTGRSKLDNFSETEFREAAEHFIVATQLDPDYAAAWAGKCEAYLYLYGLSAKAEHFEAGESACTRSLELDDSRAEVHIAVALLHSRRGQHSRAEVSLQQASFAASEKALANIGDLEQLSIQAKIDLGLVYARQGRLEEAEVQLRSAAENDPKNWQAHNSLFSFYYSYSDSPNRFELAAHHASVSAALRPDLVAPWNNIGSANFMLGNYDQAADSWEHAASIEPNRTTYTNTGLALYYAGQFEKAAEMQRRAIEIAPDDHRAWGRLGDALSLDEARGDEAIAAYVKATQLARVQLETNDQYPRTWGYLAYYLAHTDQIDNATVAAERSLDLSSRNSESLFFAAVVELLAGKENECLDLVEEAISQDPSFRNLFSIDPNFGPLAENPRFQNLLAEP